MELEKSRETGGPHGVVIFIGFMIFLMFVWGVVLLNHKEAPPTPRDPPPGVDQMLREPSYEVAMRIADSLREHPENWHNNQLGVLQNEKLDVTVSHDGWGLDKPPETIAPNSIDVSIGSSDVPGLQRKSSPEEKPTAGQILIHGEVMKWLGLTSDKRDFQEKMQLKRDLETFMAKEEK